MALEFQGIPNYVISRTQRVELLAIFLELEAETASCGQGMTSPSQNSILPMTASICPHSTKV